jgi:hypothetical protein
MSSRRIATFAALALMLAIPLAAQAKLPAPKTKTIVFGKSLGGIKLGSSLAAAKQAWGPGSSCGDAAVPPLGAFKQCTWSTTPGAQPDRGAKLTLVSTKGKVVAITIANGTGGTKAGIKGFRTAKRIGIGATLEAVRKAYPAIGPASGSPSAASVDLGSGKTVTSFFFVANKLDILTIGSPY